MIKDEGRELIFIDIEFGDRPKLIKTRSIFVFGLNRNYGYSNIIFWYGFNSSSFGYYFFFKKK